MLREHPAIRIIVIDPLGSYLGKLKKNSDDHVRPLLDNLKELAETRELRSSRSRISTKTFCNPRSIERAVQVRSHKYPVPLGRLSETMTMTRASRDSCFPLS